MKKILLLLCALLGTVGAMATDVKIANTASGLPTAAGFGDFSGQVFTTSAGSGMAGVTVTAASGVTIGEQVVNVTGYGNCFKFVTAAAATDYKITLAAPDGYVITGYSLGCSANTKNAVHTLTSEDGTVSIVANAPNQQGNVPKAFDVTGLSAQTTYFTINTANNGNTLYIPTFIITVAQEGATMVSVTYDLYESDGTTKVTSVVKEQEAGSALDVPSSLNSNTYFNYATEGTIGNEDCTIKVTRTPKDGIVYPLGNLSNSKAYKIVVPRGTYTVNDGKLANTVKSAYAINYFALISYEDKYYMWSVEANQFAAGDGATLTDTPTAITFNASTVPSFQIKSGSNTLNATSGFATGGGFDGWSTADDGNRCVIYEMEDFDPTAALAALENYFHPSYFVTYVVKDEGGKTLYTSDPEGTTLGANITTLPSEFQLSDFYDYNTVNITIAQPNTVAEFTATQKESPLVKFTADAASPVWYKMKLNDAYYPTYVADGTPNVTLPPTNADDETVQWAFVGDPYDGFQIICRAANDPTLVLGSASAANDGNTGGNTYVSFAKAGTQAYEKWFPVPSNAIAGGFYLYNGEGIALNQRSTDNLAYWTGGQGIGSTFTGTEVIEGEALYNNLIEQLEAINWGTGLNHYSLTGSLSGFAGNEAALIAQLKGEDYNETNLEAAQQMLANYALNMPAEGFYRIQGATSGKYLAAGYASNRKFNMSDATDASTLFYFDGSHLVNYGSGLSNGVTTSVWAWVTENAASTVTFHDGLTNGGYAIETNSAYFYDNGDNSNSADRGGNLTINSSTNARYTSWQLTPVNTLPVTISDAGYATLYAPVALTIPEGVSAYTGVVNKSGDNILLTAISNGKIPAETAVILKGEADSYNFEVTTANALNIANDLRGTVGGMAVTVTNNSSDVLTLQMIDDEVGLYTYAAEGVETLPLAGFKAYLPLDGGLSVKGLTFIFDEDAIKGVEANIQQAGTIFNLAGQRVSKAQKGIYIVNGKKVIVK